MAQLICVCRSMQIYDALTTVGEVPWRVNKPVLEVVEKAWAAGIRIPGLPLKHDIAPIEASTSSRFRTDSNGRQLLITVGVQTCASQLPDHYH